VHGREVEGGRLFYGGLLMYVSFIVISDRHRDLHFSNEETIDQWAPTLDLG
jgi:hypothetical protein